MTSIDRRIAQELGVRDEQVAAAVALLDGGATVPFIARYRKEATGALDDAQLRTLDERLRYLRELEERRNVILNSIREQGKLDDALEAAIRAADSKGRLEDIYLPFRPKRRTKAEIAREAGLEPLAESAAGAPGERPGGRGATLRRCRKASRRCGGRAGRRPRHPGRAFRRGRRSDRVAARGDVGKRPPRLQGAATASRKPAPSSATISISPRSSPKMPSHRILALFRGEKEEILDVAIEPESPARRQPRASRPAPTSADHAPLRHRRSRAPRRQVARSTPRAGPGARRSRSHLGADLRTRLWNAAEEEAVRVFAANLRDLLLAAPAGGRATMGLDPGYRTGVKVAVVDATGKVVATAVIYPHEPQRQWNEALAILGKLAKQHKVELISIGNGTASRETDKLATELVRLLPDQKMTKIVVSEAGASVYSASAYASEELPELDVTLRGAVSIARRLQDPLAELVKIDPKSIGVGQYQHDLGEHKLSRSLDAVVEDCVNAVGVDVNTASAPLLARVSGIGAGLAQSIVLHRDANGPFRARKALKKVPRLGPKAFEQCAGFLRIPGGEDPLDASGVHPEAYPVVRRIIEAAKTDIKGLIGNATALRALSPKNFVDETFGLPTVTDILRELEKPGRDPRPAFKAAVFAEGVETLDDLKPGMVLEGAVTNVAAFGAFVDIGVHQDGLVHISAMAKTFVKDPRDGGEARRHRAREGARRRQGAQAHRPDLAPRRRGRAARGPCGDGGAAE